MRTSPRRYGGPSRQREGISEIIANILILGMTAVMFSSIFYWVVSLKGPNEDPAMEMNPTLESDAEFVFGSQVWMNITHAGGRGLLSGFTQVTISVDGIVGFYAPRDGGLGATWAIGQKWSLLTLNDATSALPARVDPGSVVFATVLDSEGRGVLWSGQVFPRLNIFGPRIDGRTDPSPVPAQTPFLLWARIVEAEGQGIDAVSVLSADLGILVPTNMSFNFARDRWELPAPTTMPLGRYSFTVSATDGAGKVSSRVIYFVVGIITSAGPDLFVDTSSIIFSDDTPARGDEIVVTAVVFNLGGSPAGANCTFYFNVIAPANVLARVNITTIAAGGGVDATFNWIAKPGGLHTILVSCDAYPTPGADLDLGNNQAGRQIAVLPRILLVDDDQLPDTSTSSEAIYLKAAMEAADFQYDLALVGSGVGPDYDSGSTPLRDYDVVVWTSGARTASTLIETDIGKSILCGLDNGEDDVGHLAEFMCNGGRVWLVGEGILNEAGTSPWPSPSRLVSFLDTYFGFTPDPFPDSGAPAALQSTGTPLWNSKVIDFPTSLRWSPDGTDRITSNRIPPAAHTVLRDQAVPGDAYGVNNTGSGIGGAEFRTIFMSVGFASLRDPGDQAQSAYHYLLWLSGLPKKLGHDIAISSASIDPPAPRFQQDVRFNVTLRNNGGFDEANFEVLFSNTYQGVESQVSVVTIGALPAFGGETRLSVVWRPDRLGVHTLRANADWNNKIVESNENNNQISKLIFSGQVVVGFNLLLVDDDATEGALPANSTRAMVDDFVTLNSGRARPLIEYDYYRVAPGTDGPTADVMLRYNAVIWNTGQEINTVLTAADRANLTRYLEQSPVGSHLMLIAPRIYEDAVERPLNAVFLCQKLGIDFSGGSQQIVAGAPSGYSLWGAFGDGMTHGMRLALASGYPAGQLRRFLPCAGGAGALHGEVGATADDYWNTTAGMRHFMLERHNTAFRQKGVFVGTDPAYISNTSTAAGAFKRSELLYQMLHWMGAPDELGNARITPADIYVGSDYGNRIDLSNVQLSTPYVLKARIRNTGNSDVIGINVRFLDGATTIAVDTTDLDRAVVLNDWTVVDGVTVVEVIWNPLLAGPRGMAVLMDPLGIITERTKVDNRADQNSQVWFFHDDLEKGGSRWSHEAVITRINGENPIDFIPAGTAANTDIPGVWDLTRSSGQVLDANVSHSAPRSYRMQEIQAPALDVFLFFQNTNPLNSPSYDGVRNKYQVAQDAGRQFVGLMRPKDRVAIMSFNGAGGTMDPHIDRTFTFATVSGKVALNTTISSILLLSGSQPQVDGTWIAACNLISNNTWPSNRTKAIVIVTGGPSQSDEDNPGASCITGGGSNADPGTGACCGSGGATTDWAGTAGGSGVRNLPFPTFVVNVHTGNAIEMQGVAGSSCGGFYLQDPTGANIESTYRSIAILLTGGSQSRAAGAPPATLAACTPSGGMKHRWLTTPVVTLDSTLQTATVGLWHKYSMISGQNGVVFQVGLPLSAPNTPSAPGALNCPIWHVGSCGDGAAFSRENDAVHWEYIHPTKGLYNGNLNINATEQWPGGVRDDDNQTMLYSWTGVSTTGTFDWEYSEVDITRFIPGPGDPPSRQIRLNFSFYQFGGGSGKGWWADDVTIKVTRKDSAEVTGSRDQWKFRCGVVAARNTCAWANQDFDPAYGGSGYGYWPVARGLDNSLISEPIDLTRARFASLAFDAIYNVNPKAGNPPDSARVEISRDAGVSWQPVNLGIRLDAGVSGGGGSPAWVSSASLARLESNLSAWAGSVINLRFRLVTTTEPGYVHCATGATCPPPTSAGLGGFWVDNIRISGLSSGGLAPSEGGVGRGSEVGSGPKQWRTEPVGSQRSIAYISAGTNSVDAAATSTSASLGRFEGGATGPRVGSEGWSFQLMSLAVLLLALAVGISRRARGNIRPELRTSRSRVPR